MKHASIMLHYEYNDKLQAQVRTNSSGDAVLDIGDGANVIMFLKPEHMLIIRDAINDYMGETEPETDGALTVSEAIEDFRSRELAATA